MHRISFTSKEKSIEMKVCNFVMRHELCIFETDSIYILCRIKHIRQINHYKQPIFMAKMHENNFSSHEYFNLSMKSYKILVALYKL